MKHSDRQAARSRAERLMVMAATHKNEDIRRAASLELARVIAEYGFKIPSAAAGGSADHKEK